MQKGMLLIILRIIKITCVIKKLNSIVMSNYSYVLSLKLKMRKCGAVLQVEFISLICFGALFFFNIYRLFPKQTWGVSLHKLFPISNPLLFSKPSWLWNKLLLLNSFDHSLLKILTSLAPRTRLSLVSSFLSGYLSLPPSQSSFLCIYSLHICSPALHSCLIITPHLWWPVYPCLCLPPVLFRPSKIFEIWIQIPNCLPDI